MTHLPSVLYAGQILTADWSFLAAAALIILSAFLAAFIQRKGFMRTAVKLARLSELKATSVRLANEEGRESFENPAVLQPGQTFVVRAGERFATDGIVVEGNSQVDEFVVSGDHTPLAKEPCETDIARKTMRTARQNLIWSISCSAVGISLAVYGALNPVLPAVFVLTSGLAVVGNSMRLEAAIQSHARQQ